MDPSGWTPDELARVSRATELELASRRPDGSYRPYVTIWVVGTADCLYVRSAYGWNNGWFQRALKSGEGRIRAAGVERDVAFEQPGFGRRRRRSPPPTTRNTTAMAPRSSAPSSRPRP